MAARIITPNQGVTAPAHFSPRWYQLEVLQAFEAGFKMFLLLWHRRSGKDLYCIAQMAKAMLERVGNYYYYFPDAAQGKKILWNGTCKEGIPLLDRIPTELVVKKNETEMFMRLCNGSTLQIVGADKYKVDKLVGTGPAGVVMSEFGVGDGYGIVLDYMRPALEEANAWCIVQGTTRGENHYHSLYEKVKKLKDRWFVSELQTISPEYPTGRYTGLVTPTQLQEKIDEGMELNKVYQEYGVSFSAGVEGSIFGDCMTRAQDTGRIGLYPVDDHSWVETIWDIGHRDMTAIWFIQRNGSNIIWSDYFQKNLEDWPFYIQVLQNKGYRYRAHHFPHDSGNTYIGLKKKPIDFIKKCIRESGIGGIVKQHMRPNKKGALISASRARFSNYHFDSGRCHEGIRLVKKFHKRYDPVRKVFSEEAVHDESSHCCDALMLETLITAPETYKRMSKAQYVTSANDERRNTRSVLDRFNI